MSDSVGGKEMTAPDKIRWLILKSAGYECEMDSSTFRDLFDELKYAGEDGIGDAIEEFRCNGIETNIPAEYSRHYESNSLAAQLPDGSWVGWTYWYGGGKHGCPDEIEWIDCAYDLEIEEEKEVVVVQRKFKVKK